MSPLHRKSDDPLSQFAWRSRRDWRRTARRIVAEHENELMGHLHGLTGSPVLGVATTSAGTVRVTLPGWAITIVEVAAGAQADLSSTTARGNVSLADAGRYGPFWWLALAGQPPYDGRRPVVLGSRLALTPTDNRNSPPCSAFTHPDARPSADHGGIGGY